MDKSQSLTILNRQRGAIDDLRRTFSSSDPLFTKWHRDTEVAIERIFGSQSRNLNDFQKVRFYLTAFSTSTPDSEFVTAYLKGLATAQAILSSMIDEIEEYEVNSGDAAIDVSHLNVIERICLKFHSFARQLKHRYAGRHTITIEDEHDVQDLLHAILRLHFDDIRPEEYTPSYAGGAARVDFLIKSEKIIIEVKKTRSNMKSKDLGEQLIIDIARYQNHPDCHTLICFVYDPEGRLGNPVGIERDLEKYSGKMKVRVIIAPKN